MKILAYSKSDSVVTLTFIRNELKYVQKTHELLLIYSEGEINSEKKSYISKKIPYKFNKIINKLRWWLEQSELYYWLYIYLFSVKINKVIEDFKPDIIHCHFGTDFLKVMSNLNNQNKRIPILISFYGFDATERLKNKAVLKKYKHYLTLPNVHSIAVSNSLTENINTIIKPCNYAKTLNSGIDTDFYYRKKVELNSEEFVFLQVSSFIFKKGHAFTLEAFKIFITQNNLYKYKFIIVGLGTLEDEIKRQIIRLNLEDYVFLQGPITPEEMIDLSSRVNCFVHMSITTENGDQEGLPNVLLEAMSLELPILSTFHAGIPEIVENGVNGILCEEKNISQYVDGFNKIVNWTICPQNRLKIINKFSLASHMESLNKIYDEIKG